MPCSMPILPPRHRPVATQTGSDRCHKGFALYNTVVVENNDLKRFESAAAGKGEESRDVKKVW